MKIPKQPSPNTTEIWTDGRPLTLKEKAQLWVAIIFIVLLGCAIMGVLYAIALRLP